MIWANKPSWVVALFLYAHLAPDFFFRCIFCFGIGDIVSMERAPDACWLLSSAQGKRQKMSEPQVEKQRVLLHVQKHGDCLGFIERNVRFQAEFIFV
jgi:hypothetical protein